MAREHHGKMKSFSNIDYILAATSTLREYILLLHDEAGRSDGSGHGAGILSFRSQMKLIPENLSNVASEGKLGRRHPDTKSSEKRNTYYALYYK